MQQLAGMDAAFLYLETPTMPMHVLGIVVLDGSAMDGGFSYERFHGVVSKRLHLIAPFWRRLAPVPLNLDHPYWIQVDEIDLDAHLFRATVPAPGDERALSELVAELGSEPLDRDHPLWQMWVVEGLEHDRVALVAKIHHAAMYGVAGADLIAHLFDFEPEEREIEPPDAPGPSENLPSAPELIARSVLNRAVGSARAVREAAFGIGRAVGAAGDVAKRVAGRDERVASFLAPRTPLNGQLTQRRSIAFAGIPLDEVKATKDAFGVKVNDILLAVVTRALRQYLLARDALPSRAMVASCPISLGGGELESTDRIGAMLVPLPVQLDDPAEQVAFIGEATRRAKDFSSSMGMEMFATWADLIAPAAVSMGAKAMDKLNLTEVLPPVHNTVVSNIPGPPLTLYSAGARVEAIYPLGPLLPGTGLNITVLSNLDNIDVGLLACPDLVDDVWELAGAMRPASSALATAAGI